jgi:pyruvate formate lyase activating enzyme
MTGLVFNIQRFSIHDGPGIRTTVFLKGCPMRCWWCHNPESQECGPETMAGSRVMDGDGRRMETVVGRWKTALDVFREIESDLFFYSESGGGMTLSGGEPMMQDDFAFELLKLCKDKGIHTAIDTSGHAEPASFRKILTLADLFLFDLKLIDDARHVEYTGVSNELALRNLEMVARSGSSIIIRFPVIPGITDDPSNIRMIAGLMKRLQLNRIDLLPYHSFARDKYRRLGRDYLLDGVEEPKPSQMEMIREVFFNSGIDTGYHQISKSELATSLEIKALNQNT